jgi:hypothetical protein
LGAGVVTAFDAVSALPASVESWSDDPTTGLLWAVTNGQLPDGGIDNGVYALDDTTLQTNLDVPLPANVVWDGLTWTPFSPSTIIALPGLNKVYFGVQAGPGEVVAMDETSHTVTTLAQLNAIGETVAALAFDSARQQVYAGVNSFLQNDAGAYFADPGYVLAFDATDDHLVSTLDPLPIADVATPACSTTSSTSCFLAQTELAVDATGQELYLFGQDQYSEPMAATFVLNGGPLQNVIGGITGGWLLPASGIVTFGDGGAMVGLELSDGGGSLQPLGQAPPASVPFHPTAVAPFSLGTCANGEAIPGGSVVAFTGTSGNPEVDAFSWGQRLGPLVQVSAKSGALNACVGSNITAMEAKMKGGFQVNGQSESCLVLTVTCAAAASPPTAEIAEVATQLCCP